MKKKIILFLITLSLLTSFSFKINIVKAEEEQTYLSKYKAIEMLFSYFDIEINPEYEKEQPTFKQYWRDIWPSNNYYKYINTACEIELITCNKDKFFDGEGPVSLPAFFKMFYTLKYKNQPQVFEEKFLYTHVGEWYFPYILEAKRTRILSSFEIPFEKIPTNLTYEILEKNNILNFYEGLIESYFLGLEKKEENITPYKYHNFSTVTSIIKKYEQLISEKEEKIERLRDQEKKEIYLEKITHLKKIEEQFKNIKTELEKNPFFYDPTIPDNIKQIAREFGIKEKIGESFYDFSSSAWYRKYNIKYALSKINGKVLQPGEEFNFANMVYDKGLWGFKMGWVISGGEEVLAPGGGICGSATVVFEGAYRSGLEITERKNHSIFYGNLYSREKIGLDATVYRPRPNVRFVNNTGYPLVIHIAYPEEFKANVQFLGTKYFDFLTLQGPNLERTTTRWIRTIFYKNGGIGKDELVSRYGRIY